MGNQNIANMEDRAIKAEEEVLNLYRKLAAVKLDSSNVWSRYESINISRGITEYKLLRANEELHLLRNLHNAVLQQVAMYEGTSDEFNMMESEIVLALKELKDFK